MQCIGACPEDLYFPRAYRRIAHFSDRPSLRTLRSFASNASRGLASAIRVLIRAIRGNSGLRQENDWDYKNENDPRLRTFPRITLMNADFTEPTRTGFLPTKLTKRNFAAREHKEHKGAGR
jgi:hypothetical protein